MYQQLALAPGVWAVVVAEEDDDGDKVEDKGGRHPGKMVCCQLTLHYNIIF